MPLTAKARSVEYILNNVAYSITVPARNQKPTIAYASCNGFSDSKLMKNVADQNALWKRMRALHDGVDAISTTRYGPRHILQMGGDQVYSDAMWNKKYCRNLATWAELPWDKRKGSTFTLDMQNEVERFFEDLYISRWSQPEISQAMASIPSVMMWNDHDIFDGWGSYPFVQHNCEVYQGIFKIAKAYFKLFQLQAIESLPSATLPDQDVFNQAYRIAGMGVMVLDMRLERMPHNPEDEHGNSLPDQVMSEKSWNAVYKWLDAQQGLSHLLVMSSIPVVHSSMSLLETMLGFIPGQQELEDD